jgi:putative methyltransferase (TIGR04325 family)
MSLKRQMVERLGSRPLLRPLAMMAYEDRFTRQSGGERLFRGIYPDFPTAIAAAPRNSLAGHDHAAYANGVVHSPGSPLPSDYPVLFWLSKILDAKPAARIFDWGGNTGISYHVYRQYLDFSDGLEWIVNDVPSVVAQGEALRSERPAPGLSFTTSLAPLESCDIVLAAGSLQVIEDPLAALQAAPRLPTHVLANKLPVYERSSAVTLLNNGVSYCPYRLFERAEFVNDLKDIGYTLVDEWRIPELACHIPFHPEFSVPSYSGFYFVRRAGV